MKININEDKRKKIVTRTINRAVHKHLVAEARELGYDSPAEVALDLDSADPDVQSRVTDFKATRDSVLGFAVQSIKDVHDNKRSMPDKFAFIAELKVEKEKRKSGKVKTDES